MADRLASHGVAAQAGKAALAASIAASTSANVETGTRLLALPFTGFMACLLAVVVRASPSMML